MEMTVIKIQLQKTHIDVDIYLCCTYDTMWSIWFYKQFELERYQVEGIQIKLQIKYTLHFLNQIENNPIITSLCISYKLICLNMILT